MGRQSIDVSARSAAPRDAVWEVLADAERWHEWGPWKDAELEREGASERGGAGSVKRMTAEQKALGRTVVMREEITVFEPGEAFGYRVLSGLSVRDYEARVTLADAERGTAIRWQADFHPKVPGTGGVLRRGLTRTIGDVVERVAREAERRAPAVDAA